MMIAFRRVAFVGVFIISIFDVNIVCTLGSSTANVTRATATASFMSGGTPLVFFFSVSREVAVAPSAVASADVEAVVHS